MARHVSIVCGVALLLAALVAPRTAAHKAITSPYNFNDHVYPILRERCSRCHVEGGPTPMSLMSYKDALPWAESMREQLVGEKMPPWYADPLGPGVKGGHPLPTKELDILVTWAVGGTPQGEMAKDPPSFVPPAPQWRAGTPDETIAMAAEHTLPPGTMEDSKEFTLTTGFKEVKWIKAVDLMPGIPSMVRAAIVSVQNGPVLATWVPGHDATAAPNGTAFKLTPGARLTLQMHYKKNWMDEQEARADKSTIGLYFTDPPISGRELEALSIAGPSGETLEPRTFAGALKTASRVVAVRPSFDQAYASMDVQAVLQGGRRVVLLKLRAAQPQWYRRYWLAEPVELPAGARIEVVATPAPPDEFAIPTPRRYPLQVAVDYVAQ